MSCNRAPGAGTPITGGHRQRGGSKQCIRARSRQRVVIHHVMVTPDYIVYTDQLKAILNETMIGKSYPGD